MAQVVRTWNLLGQTVLQLSHLHQRPLPSATEFNHGCAFFRDRIFLLLHVSLSSSLEKDLSYRYRRWIAAVHHLTSPWSQGGRSNR